MLGRDAFCFGTLRQGQAVEARCDESRFVQAGRGQLRRGGLGLMGHGSVRSVRRGTAWHGGRGAAHGFWYA